MKFPVNVPQTISGHVGVNFRRADVRVSEQLLDDPQVGTVLKQVRGEAVAEHVGSDAAFNAGVTNPVFNV